MRRSALPVPAETGNWGFTVSPKFRTALFIVTALMLSPAAAQAAREEMRFIDVYMESETDSPRACFQFTRNLKTRGGVHYEDYVRFEPEFPAEITARGHQLCVSGMNHGQVYSATLLNPHFPNEPLI